MNLSAVSLQQELWEEAINCIKMQVTVAFLTFAMTWLRIGEALIWSVLGHHPTPPWCQKTLRDTMYFFCCIGTFLGQVVFQSCWAFPCINSCSAGSLALEPRCPCLLYWFIQDFSSWGRCMIKEDCLCTACNCDFYLLARIIWMALSFRSRPFSVILARQQHLIMGAKDILIWFNIIASPCLCGLLSFKVKQRQRDQ